MIWSDKLFYAKTHVKKKSDRFLVPLMCYNHTMRIVRRAKARVLAKDPPSR